MASRWFDFTGFEPKAYMATRVSFYGKKLTVYPLDVGADEFRKGVSSGNQFEYRLGSSAAMQREGESEQAFLLRCAADGKWPEFMETDEGGQTDIIDMSTGESLMAARAKAIAARKKRRII